jgi:hypothetical protein
MVRFILLGQEGFGFGAVEILQRRCCGRKRREGESGGRGELYWIEWCKREVMKRRVVVARRLNKRRSIA